MNRYPLWGYILIFGSLILAAIYALPNLYGEQPAVQISAAKPTLKVDTALKDKIESILKNAGYPTITPAIEGTSIRIRVDDTNLQMKLKDIVEKGLNQNPAEPDYIVALNLISASPDWLTAIGAKPMYLGLDLRGGVHFLLQVDMQGAIEKKLDSSLSDIRTVLREKRIRHDGIRRDKNRIVIRFSNQETLDEAKSLLESRASDLTYTAGTIADQPVLYAAYSEAAQKRTQENALKQNIATLSNRVNELGVSEPVIQQQGADRIVIQLPGVQDTAKAKDIIGRTATLELRMVDDAASQAAVQQGSALPPGVDTFIDRSNPGRPVQLPVKKEVILGGDRLIDAQAGFDDKSRPAVNLKLDPVGARIFRDISRENINKRMAIILFEKGHGEIITAPVIRSEIPNGDVSISGSMTVSEANDLALLLRAGSLAAPMEIIEERTIGPSLGAENIRMGVRATITGLIIISVFMIFYYHLFGLFSVCALTANLLLLIAILSCMQATLTLQGIAAIALTLGVAIDSNVLINERLREELRIGLSPQMAISEGYARAFDTILDSNITSLIVGIALLVFGTGPIRSFAIVHCLGIVTSVYSSVFVSRAIANLVYGKRKNLKTVSVGQVWKPAVQY